MSMLSFVSWQSTAEADEMLSSKGLVSQNLPSLVVWCGMEGLRVAVAESDVQLFLQQA